MDIHDLVIKFIRLGGTEVGRGPGHPTNPDSDKELKIDINEFFKLYPFLRKDPSYVDFIECYAGASLSWDNPAFMYQDLIIDIYGFTWVISTDFREHGEENWGDSFLDEQGFFIFSSLLIRTGNGDDREKDFSSIVFAFDSTLNRKPGVYGRLGVDGEWRWLYGSFLEWFDQIIEKKGRVLV